MQEPQYILAAQAVRCRISIRSVSHLVKDSSLTLAAQLQNRGGVEAASEPGRARCHMRLHQAAECALRDGFEQALEGSPGVEMIEQVAFLRLFPTDVHGRDRPEVQPADVAGGEQPLL